MLAYVLAWVVGLGSLALYLAAFFFPEVHRKNDFILSGIGMFYALVLWVCAGRITGGLLLGQIASVVVLGWLGWETVNLRRGIVPTDEQTALPSAEAIQTALSNLTKPETLAGLPGQVMGGVNTFVGRVQEAIAAGAKAKQAASKPVDTYVPLKREDFAEAAKTVQAVVEDEIATTAATTAFLGAATEEILSETAASLSETAVETAAEAVASLQATEQTLEETLAAAVKAVESGPTVIPPAPVPAAPTVLRPEVRSTIPKAAPAAGTSLPSQVLGAIAGIAASLPAVLQKLTKKKESQPIYVRKQFRADDAVTPVDADGPVDTDSEPTQPGTGTEVAAGVVTAAVVAAAVVTTVQEPVPETTPELAEESATEGSLVDLLAESTAELIVEPEMAAIADLPIEPEMEPPIVEPEVEPGMASAEAAGLDLIDEPLTEPPAEPPAEPLTDVVLANLAQDLFQSLDANVGLADGLAGTATMPADSVAEADTAAMELYETADGTATDGTATTVNLGTPDTTPGAPDDEFGDQWSGSQIPADEPELPIDPPFMDE